MNEKAEKFGREEFEQIAGTVASLEDDKKSIANDIKTNVEECATRFGLDKKALGIAIKKYLAYQEDHAAFLIQEGEVEKILSTVIDRSDETGA